MVKKIFRYFKFFLLIFAVLCGNKVSINSVVTKSENYNLNKTLDLHAMALKLEEIKKNDIYSAKDVYNGVLTGYVADCPLCNGHLGCNGQNVLDRTVTYDDPTYGTVRIVASSTSLACGSIVKFNLNNEDITAIVLDRGVLGTALDLLVASEDEAIKNIGRKNISYDILRFGYNKSEL